METYETFSTTADVGIRIQGNGTEELYRSAIKGLNLLYFGEHSHSFHSLSPTSLYPFEYTGDSCENVLVNLLSEIVFLVQHQGNVVIDILFHHATDTCLKADFKTAPLPLTPELDIKSVTYHNLKVNDDHGLKSTEIIFDI
ncbi:MAG: archease [Candidatus Omnitrophota bacterium]